MFADFAIPEYRKILGDAVAAQAEPGVELELETDVRAIHVSLRRKGDALVLHLINYTGSMIRPIDGIVPHRKVKVRLKAGSGGGKWSAKALRTCEDLHVTMDEKGIAFTLPELYEYEVIAISR